LIGLWNSGALQEDWNDTDAAFQRGPYLDAHEVIGVLQAPATFLVARIEPTRTDDRQQRVTLGDLLANYLDEVGTQRNGVDVHEQETAAEFSLKSVVYPAGVACGVVAPVTNEQFRGHSGPPVGAVTVLETAR
jgi:hypothetical protein